MVKTVRRPKIVWKLISGTFEGEGGELVETNARFGTHAVVTPLSARVPPGLSICGYPIIALAYAMAWDVPVCAVEEDGGISYFVIAESAYGQVMALTGLAKIPDEVSNLPRKNVNYPDLVINLEF